MRFRTFRNLVLISCLSVTSSGCSFILVKGPPQGHENLAYFPCTDSKTLPTLEAIWAGLNLAGGALLAREDAISSGETNAAMGLGWVLMLGASALTGLKRVDDCRAARLALAQRNQQAAAERDPTMAGADSVSVDATPTRGPPEVLVATPGAPDLQLGAWTGTLFPPGGPGVAVEYEVGETDGALSIVMSVPEVGESITFNDIDLNGDDLTFWWEPGDRVDCTLRRKDDGSFEGICTDGTGADGEGTLTMLPPSR